MIPKLLGILGILSTLVPGIPAANSKAQACSYGVINFIAPNTPSLPYQVLARKNGKILWSINDKKQKNREQKAGGIDKMLIKNVAENDLDRGAGNYRELKKYVGKPALYIYYSKETVVNRLPSCLIVDLNTGRQIAFMAFN